MTEDEATEFTDLFREYRNIGRLPPDKRKRFRELAAMAMKDKRPDEDGKEST
jgi:hypothetical protein